MDNCHHRGEQPDEALEPAERTEAMRVRMKSGSVRLVLAAARRSVG